MESQMHRPTEQEHPQQVASDTEMVESQAEHGEKKSVLKKVKDKAKKIKDTIKKHGLGHEDVADDQETNTNLAVHGEPAREHPVITGTNLPMQTGFNLEKPSDTREDRYDHSGDVKGEEYTSLREKGVTSPPQAMETEFKRPTPETHEPEIKNMTKPDAIDVSEVQVPQSAVKPATTFDVLEEDRQEDTNHQTKVLDPTGQGGKEAEVGSLTQGLKNLAVINESKSSAQREQTQSDESKSLPEEEQSRSYTGSHDQFALQSTPTEESFIPQSHHSSTGGKEAEVGSLTQGLKNVAVSDESKSSALREQTQSDESKSLPEQEHSRSYTGSHDQFALQSTPTDESFIPQSHRSSTGGKEAEVGSLIQGLENVAVSDESKSIAQREQTQSDESKSLPEQEQSRSYTGSNDQFALQSTPTDESFIPQSHPMPADEPKSYDPNRPESMPGDSITGKIDDEAASAKNAVASKLGDDNTKKKPLTESAAEYKNLVVEKLAPVYEKVSGAGTTVMSKVRGSGTGEQQQGGGGGDEASRGPGKGVSVRDYLSEKFKPGDEDKALSEAISQKLQVKKKPADENEAPDKSKTDVSSPGVMGSLKGVVGSWLGKSSGAESAAAAADDQLQSHETAAQDETNVEQKMKQ